MRGNGARGKGAGHIQGVELGFQVSGEGTPVGLYRVCAQSVDTECRPGFVHMNCLLWIVLLLTSNMNKSH